MTEKLPEPGREATGPVCDLCRAGDHGHHGKDQDRCGGIVQVLVHYWDRCHCRDVTAPARKTP